MNTADSEKSRLQESLDTDTISVIFQVLCKAGSFAAQNANDEWGFGHAHGLIEAARLVMELKDGKGS